MLTAKFLGRRAFSSGLASVCFASSLLPPRRAKATVPQGKVSCLVMRAGRQIGLATYDFSQHGDSLTVSINIDIRIRLGFITMFRYVHANTEHWQNGSLIELAARTNNNGKSEYCTVIRGAGGLAVTGSHTAPYVAPANALGTSYWNIRTLTDPLINAQNGHLLDVRLTNAGPSAALLSTGTTVLANEWKMTGDMKMNLWYDAARDFAGLQYYAHDGSIVTYERS